MRAIARRALVSVLSNRRWVRRRFVVMVLVAVFATLSATVAQAQQQSEAAEDAATEQEPEEDKRVTPAPPRGEGDGEGPFERLIIRGATMIDGTGSPPYGPVDIVIEGNRIAEIESAGTPG